MTESQPLTDKTTEVPPQPTKEIETDSMSVHTDPPTTYKFAERITIGKLSTEEETTSKGKITYCHHYFTNYVWNSQ